MSENNQPKVKIPKVFKPIPGAVPSCPHCKVDFQEAVDGNYPYTCPICKQDFYVEIKEKSTIEE